MMPHIGYKKRILSWILDFFMEYTFVYYLFKILKPFIDFQSVKITFIFGISNAALWLFLPSLLQSSLFQASLGQIFLNIKVVDVNNQTLSFWRAFYRNAILFFCWWGTITWFFSPKRQCLHDILSDSLVLDSGYNREYTSIPLKKISTSIILLRFFVTLGFPFFMFLWLMFK